MQDNCAMDAKNPQAAARDEQEVRLEKTLSKIKHRWLVLSGKGGVGKSTVATNLACAMRERKQRVGLLDIDLHGPNVAKMLGIEGQGLHAGDSGIMPTVTETGLKVVSMAAVLPAADTAVVWRGPRKMGAIRQFLADVDWGDLDHLVVDSPPGTGDEPLSAAQLMGHVDGAIIVTTPQDVALLDSSKCVNFARQVDLPILGIIENMSGMICPHCGEELELFGQGGGEKAARDLNLPFLGRIPFEPGVVRSSDAGRPHVLSRPGGPATRAFEALVDHILEQTQEQ